MRRFYSIIKNYYLDSIWLQSFIRLGNPFNYYCVMMPALSVCPVQVFYAITRLVLQTKKETAKDGGSKDTIRVSKGASTKKKKCC